MKLNELRKVPHHSHSSISCFLNCGLKYYLKYVQKLEAEAQSVNLLTGSVFHKTLDFFMGQLMKGRKVSEQELKEYFELEWSNTIACSKLSFQNEEDEVVMREKCVEMLTMYIEQFDKGQEIISHSEAFIVQVEGVELPIIGEFDMVLLDQNKRPVIVDFKTASRSWPAGKENSESQATLYLYAFQQIYGKSADFRFDVVTKSKQPKILVLPTSRKGDDFSRMIRIYKQVERGINAGIFIPNDTSFFCSGCEYAKACESWGKCQKAA